VILKYAWGENMKNRINQKNVLLILSVVAVLFLAAGCSSAVTEGEDPLLEDEAPLLKVGLMPAVDSAPVLLAEKNGYFQELGLDVELQIFNNPQDRQSALQTHNIDGTITDLIAVAVNVDGGFDIKATTTTNGVFPVLLKEGADQKKEIKVGMMEVSVTNFLIDEWLGDEYIIEKVYINDIPAAFCFGVIVGSFPFLIHVSYTIKQGLPDQCRDFVKFRQGVSQDFFADLLGGENKASDECILLITVYP
jgi:ABC-type nitrate/sulfonate/bicarbonate transport system substrate-binding protein